MTHKVAINCSTNQKLVSRVSIIEETIRLMMQSCKDVPDTMGDLELYHNGAFVYIMKNVPVGATFGLLFLHGLIK